MKANLMFSGLLLLCFWMRPEQAAAQKNGHDSRLNPADHELISERTRFSRTFLNRNKTKTVVRSSDPLHYMGTDGQWHDLDYGIGETAGTLIYPAQEPIFEWKDGKTLFRIGTQEITWAADTRFVYAATNGDALRTDRLKATAPQTKSPTELVFPEITDGISRTVSLFRQAMEYSYRIQDNNHFPVDFHTLFVEETLQVPAGYGLQVANDGLVFTDAKGKVVMRWERPIVSDSPKPLRDQRQRPMTAAYEITPAGNRKFRVRMAIDGSWLKSPDRVFPVVIDPVVTLTNTDVVNSCFYPAYQQATLAVDVPAGETVLSTHISYDFVAVDATGAWLSDQRSYVTGPNGSTTVFAGTGNVGGMQTYDIPDSAIGNSVSTGQVAYTFNFSRNWGGTACDAIYNFVSRHEVQVTYGTIEFGDGPLLINEYSASNRFFNDAFGRNEDWIELYNASPDTYFNLAGYHLSNNINNPTKWQIQEGVIPPNSKILIYCSNRDIASGPALHASFDLTQTDPDEIVLADPDGNIMESLNMFVTQTNHSYGRTSDGASTWSVFSTATPGLANTGGFQNYTSKPTFGTGPGKFSGPITVTLAASGENEQIRYTTNGATPTASSTLYTGPIAVSQNTVIRARAFSSDPAILPGFIETNTYFINDDSTLPVVSLSGDANLLDLFNGNQIEPTGYLEYFEPDGTFVDENMGDFDKHGNDSWAYSQRGVDFISRDDHGYKRRLEHQFFDTSDRDTFRRLIFKAAGSDNYPFQEGGAHLRDVFVQKVSEVAGLDMDERRSTFVSLFVNGQYWGVYDMREKVDDNQYTDYYYGQDYIFRDSDQYIQYIKTWGSTLPEFGNQPAIDAWEELMAFVQNNDMALEANYQYVDSQLNINSLVDYFVLNSYMVNKDWLNWNTSWWRGLDPSGGALKWRYALWDCDGVLGHYINYTGIPDISADADPCNVEELEVGVGHAQTIAKLIEESPIVRQQYIARYADLLNTHLSCDQVTQIFDAIVANIAPEMPRQIARWGGSVEAWQANVQEARDFLMTRCSQTISSGMVECYDVTGPYATIFQVEPAGTGQIKMNSEWLTEYPFTAQVFGNLETLVKARAEAGYEFSHWVVDGAVISPDDTTPDIVLNISQATMVTAYFTEITNSEQALYYWHFNTLETPEDVTQIPADFSLIPEATPMMTYTGSGPRDIDANNSGSILNLHFDEVSGRCARVRNPSEGRSLVFDLPTSGYQDIKFAFAVHRTNEGQLINHVAYSTDGSNFVTDGLAQSSFDLNTEFSLIDLDLSAITAVNDNPDFKIRITFEGNTTADNGNNRYDNITLKGTQQVLSLPEHADAQLHVYPNPFSEKVFVRSSETLSELVVHDLVGKRILKKENLDSGLEMLDLGGLNAGVYLLRIKTAAGWSTQKIVKH